MLEKVRAAATEFLTGDTTMTKKEFWLTVTSCTLAGVLVGLFLAPVTRGIIIGSNNGNGNGCGNREYHEDDQDDATECIGVDEL
ncbi:MAG: hypothetical protein PHE02_08105 [Lachnospiraceae bacterium]|nr:hypothetical protein [Lachnospiraceae bacterium]